MKDIDHEGAGHRHSGEIVKDIDHEGAHVVYQRGRLKRRRDFYWRFGIVFFLGGAVFGKVNQLYDAYEACFAGLSLGLLFLATSKGMDRHIAAYDRRQEAIVANIWQE